MDRLARTGILFKNHFVQVPTCGPSRHALLTGMRPNSREGLSNYITSVTLANRKEEERPETFIHHLRRNNYYTVGIGKISHSADGLVYSYTEQPSQKRELPYSWDELIFDEGKWGTGWNAFFGYASGENRQSLAKKVKPYESGDVKDNGYPDGLTAQLAIQKLHELKNRDRPFFLGVGFFKPHLPFNAPKKYWDLYDRNEIPISAVSDLPENVHHSSLHESGEFNQYKLTDEKASLSGSISDEYARKLKHAYYASVSYTDAQIGKLLNALTELELEDDTIVVMWGDHGWHLGDHRVWGKHTLFDVSLKSALTLRVPGIGKNGSEIDQIVETVDIYPTLMELCGIAMPYVADGKSLVQSFDDPKLNKGDVAYSYFRNGISMRTDRYRITRYFREEEPTVELYDHRTDPYESKNIAESEPGLVEQLLGELQKGNTGLYN